MRIYRALTHYGRVKFHEFKFNSKQYLQTLSRSHKKRPLYFNFITIAWKKVGWMKTKKRGLTCDMFKYLFFSNIYEKDLISTKFSIKKLYLDTILYLLFLYLGMKYLSIHNLLLWCKKYITIDTIKNNLFLCPFSIKSN